MAAFAALVSLTNNIEQITKHPRLSNCFVNEQMESLLQEAGSLLDFIEGGSNHGGLFTQEAEALEREITSTAHAAEDVVESHVVDQIHAGTLRSLDLQRVIRDMGAVAGKAMEVKEKEGVREEEEEQPPTHPTPLEESGGVTAMVGLDDELTQLLDMLTDHNQKRQVISIVGMGGTGKTTLAQNLYSHQVVKERFDIRAWATVSQQYDLQDTLSQQYSLQEILSQLLSCIRKSTEGEVGELGERLHKTLYGIRYLIVLDDIWSVKAWDEVRRYLPDGDNRSRLVLTTRLSNIVASVVSSSCFNLNLLDEDRSWKLFCEKALFPHKDDEMEDVAKRIVKSCKGLALSIVVIGGFLLKSPRTLRYWKDVLYGLRSTDSIEKQEGLDALSLSYNHLPPHLKPCFLYLGVFKEDSRIRASNVTKMWVSEGFIKPKGNRVLEEIAEGYLKDLSDRNLVIVAERRFSGKIKSFSIHDLLRDLCIKVAEQQRFYHVRSNYGTRTRRVVCDSPNSTIKSRVTRSILGRAHNLKRVTCKLVRVLDATEGTGHRGPAEPYGNVNLRYLAHRRPFEVGGVVELPTSVCLMWNLQTLIIKLDISGYSSSSNVVSAPLEIWKMRQLRHVKLSDIYLPDPYQNDKQYCMEELQTLKRAMNLRLSEGVCETIPNIRTLGLVYDPQMEGFCYSFIPCLHNLDRFHKLESLYLGIKSMREGFRRHSKLAFPLSLNKLWLSETYLSWEDLSVIGSLPQLQVLRLKFYAVMEGDTWSPVTGQFRGLKLLEIVNCQLRCWDADNSHFPVLEKLVLKYLYFLEEIPPEIGEIPTLELIRVDNCSESSAISAVKIKKDQLENHDNEALQIEVAFFESKMESFRRRVETEELALSLFKFELILRN